MESKDSVARLIGLLAAGLLAMACFLVLRPFVSALLGAVILVFCTWPIFRFLTNRLSLRPGYAAVVMVALEFLLLGLPLLLATPVTREDVEGIRAWIERVLTEGLPDLSAVLLPIPLVGERLNAFWDSLAGDSSQLTAILSPYAGTIAQQALGLLLLLLSGLAEVLIAILLAFFIYRDGPAIAAHCYRLLERLAGERALHLWELTGNVTRGVVYGLLGTALAQGFLTAFGLWVAGVPQPVLLGVIAGVISILPVGAPLVWLPASIWLFATDSWGWGLFMLLYGALGISSVDNVIRPWLIARGADLPLLLTLLGALGGVFAFGFLGLFLGPVVLAVGYALLLDWGGVKQAPPP
ncbi:MAG TPA: AI-2E family transporter [Roseococcus sp.]|jgi:predicted PurR-regulated permease PerM|nr:AI-2E family transporter [Roseococcus sp.]